MLTIPTTPEFESRLQTEAAKLGLNAPELVLRLIEDFMAPPRASEATERERLGAIDELMGMGNGANFSSYELRRERNEEIERDERRFEASFGTPKNP